MSIISYIVNMDEFVDEMIYQLKKDFELTGGDSTLGMPRIMGEIFDGSEKTIHSIKIPITFTGLLRQIIIKKKSPKLKAEVYIKIDKKIISFPMTNSDLILKNNGVDYLIDGQEIEIEVIVDKKDKVLIDFMCLVPTEEGDI